METKLKLTFDQRCLKNALRDLVRFQLAERQTFGKEKAKYRQGITNLKTYIACIRQRLGQ